MTPQYTNASSKPKPKGALIAALVFLLLGIGGCGFAAAKTVPYISDLVDFATELDQVGRVVSMGEEVSFTASGADGIALLSEEAVCTGEGPSGPVSFQAYEAFGPGTTVELGGVRINGYMLFDIESGSEYTIRCGDGSTFGSYTATTAPSFLVEGAPGFVGGILAGGAGAFFVFIAFILFIVGMVQRSSWKKKQKQTQGPAAPGGYGASPQQVPHHLAGVHPADGARQRSRARRRRHQPCLNSPPRLRRRRSRLPTRRSPRRPRLPPRRDRLPLRLRPPAGGGVQPPPPPP
ncbi:MAG: hypothetical protein M5U19_15510 [Microthrixaceae bacterium]|nr:hypothetical protein [Microthrixaceae bacterium]